MERILTVRNIEQQAAWLELDGQISDGFWENARPENHYKPWCEAKVVVDPTNVGRNFPARKDSYNFNDGRLISIIGRRMLAVIRIARRFGIQVAEVLEYAPTTDGTLELNDGTRAMYQQAARIAGFATSDALFTCLQEAVADPTYSMRDMRADLRDLKVIVRRAR